MTKEYVMVDKELLEACRSIYGATSKSFSEVIKSAIPCIPLDVDAEIPEEVMGEMFSAWRKEPTIHGGLLASAKMLMRHLVDTRAQVPQGSIERVKIKGWSVKGRSFHASEELEATNCAKEMALMTTDTVEVHAITAIYQRNVTVEEV